MKKAKDATMPQLDDPPHTTSTTKEDDKTNEEEVDQSQADVLPDDKEHE